jgi:hypothetical protein
MSKIEVNAIEPQSGTTLTIGASGDTVALAVGATSSGFGATYNGAVNWDTTPKTSGFTAVSGVGYFVNTTAGAITVTLPTTPTAGAIVAISDYANTSATNNITVGRNGSKIDGENKDAVIFVNGQVYTLVYVDATEGWKTVNQTFNQITLPAFVAATGGTVTCCGNYKIHTFTGPGTFTVTNAGNPAGSTTVDYLVVAGGASGAGGSSGPSGGGGGGGAGGFRESKATGAPWTASPLASSTSLPVTVTGYPITVGSGGAGGPANSAGGAGNSSIFSTITSAGGGGGGYYLDATPANNNGRSGGSGGGAAGGNPSTQATGGAGNTPPVAPSQGNPGGNSITAVPSSKFSAAGGGGATSAGTGVPAANPGGPGGNGATTSISGSPTSYAGGGGGSGGSGCGVAPGGTGGPGGGVAGASNPPVFGGAGSANTGGGGGGSWPGQASTSSAGGSGIVVIRYKFQ